MAVVRDKCATSLESNLPRLTEQDFISISRYVYNVGDMIPILYGKNQGRPINYVQLRRYYIIKQFLPHFVTMVQIVPKDVQSKNGIDKEIYTPKFSPETFVYFDLYSNILHCREITMQECKKGDNITISEYKDGELHMSRCTIEKFLPYKIDVIKEVQIDENGQKRRDFIDAKINYSDAYISIYRELLKNPEIQM